MAVISKVYCVMTTTSCEEDPLDQAFNHYFENQQNLQEQSHEEIVKLSYARNDKHHPLLEHLGSKFDYKLLSNATSDAPFAPKHVYKLECDKNGNVVATPYHYNRSLGIYGEVSRRVIDYYYTHEVKPFDTNTMYWKAPHEFYYDHGPSGGNKIYETFSEVQEKEKCPQWTWSFAGKEVRIGGIRIAPYDESTPSYRESQSQYVSKTQTGIIRLPTYGDSETFAISILNSRRFSIPKKSQMAEIDNFGNIYFPHADLLFMYNQIKIPDYILKIFMQLSIKKGHITLFHSRRIKQNAYIEIPNDIDAFPAIKEKLLNNLKLFILPQNYTKIIDSMKQLDAAILKMHQTPFENAGVSFNDDEHELKIVNESILKERSQKVIDQINKLFTGLQKLTAMKDISKVAEISVNRILFNEEMFKLTLPAQLSNDSNGIKVQKFEPRLVIDPNTFEFVSHDDFAIFKSLMADRRVVGYYVVEFGTTIEFNCAYWEDTSACKFTATHANNYQRSKCDTTLVFDSPQIMDPSLTKRVSGLNIQTSPEKWTADTIFHQGPIVQVCHNRFINTKYKEDRPVFKIKNAVVWELDNHGGLYQHHFSNSNDVSSKIYIMGNKTPFPQTCFEISKLLNTIPFDVDSKNKDVPDGWHEQRKSMWYKDYFPFFESRRVDTKRYNLFKPNMTLSDVKTKSEFMNLMRDCLPRNYFEVMKTLKTFGQLHEIIKAF